MERSGTNGIRIVLVGNYPGEPAVYPGEDIYFKYDGSLLPGENGIFTNNAVITAGSEAPRTTDAMILRDGAGGDGSGDGRTIAPVAPEVVQAQCTEVGGPDDSVADPG